MFQAVAAFAILAWIFYGAFLCCAFLLASWYIRARVIAPGVASGTKHLAEELSRIADALQLIQQQAVAPRAAGEGHTPPGNGSTNTLPSQKIPTTPGRVFNSMFGRRY
jgi:hypothetical protein